MKIFAPQNKNYCATVVKVKSLTPLDGCDNVVGTPFFGFQAIVKKDVQIGGIGVMFPGEVQLSELFCKENNLYKHAELNKNPDEKGYIEDTRRVRAIKFRGHRSDCLFLPLFSLAWTKVNVSELKEGDEFDVLNGQEICKKYVVRVRVGSVSANHQPKAKTFKRVDTKYIPEHFDSENYFKRMDQIPPETEIIVTQKLHGTSIRIGHTIVRRKLRTVERLAKLLGAKVQETEHDYVFGSRRLIKDVNNPHSRFPLAEHFYDSDIWSSEGKKLEGVLPENFLIYGELIGWTPANAAIQKNYTYQIPLGERQLYVYRVAQVNSQGLVTDFAWSHVQEFCAKHGLLAVPEVFRGPAKNFDVSKYLDVRLNETYRHCLALSRENETNAKSPKLVDEGVCIRVDTITPYILKAKSPRFLQHETALLDKGEVDLEAENAV